MKKIFTLILGITLAYSCSTSSDENGNSNTTVVPLPPTNLTGSIANNQIILTWLDNSTNETGFKIERKTGSGAWSEIGSVNTNIYTYSDATVNSATTYTYRVYAFNSTGNSLNYSNEITITTLLSVATTAITNVTTTTVTSGGNISFGGGSSVTARGVVWSTNPSPNISLPTKTTDGSGTGSFTSAVSALTSNTVYYLRAYATNFSGTSYGNEITFTSAFAYAYSQGQTLTDINGNTYSTINTNCNNKTWMQSNLNVSKFKNGDIIPQATNTSDFNSGSPAWCYYNNDPANEAIYGKLYNRAAVYDQRGLAPEGWHISTEVEWNDLINCLGGPSVAGGKLKATGTQIWASPNVGASNSSGFKALPGGWRTNNGSFSDISGTSYFWATRQGNIVLATYAIRNVEENIESAIILADLFRGYSVRCVKD
jgi:uncharacterized protein (TIGR02145 family)